MEGGVTGDESRLRPLVGAPGVVAYPGNIGPPLARSRGAYTTGRHRYTDNDNDADRRSSSVLACAVVAVGAHRRARDRVFQGIPAVVSLRSSIYFFFFFIRPFQRRARYGRGALRDTYGVSHTQVPQEPDPGGAEKDRNSILLFLLLSLSRTHTRTPRPATSLCRDRNWEGLERANRRSARSPHAFHPTCVHVDDSWTSDSGTVRVSPLLQEGVSAVTVSKSTM